MREQQAKKWLQEEDTAAIELRSAIRSGDVEALRRLLAEDPGLTTARLVGRRGSSRALHLVAVWPGYAPDGPQLVHALIDAGADPNALTTREGTKAGPGPETPLHYAASTDDVDVAKALIDRGANSRCRAVRSAHRSTPPAGWEPGRRTSSPGYESSEPPPPTPIDPGPTAR